MRKIKCRFGDINKDHYDNKEEARAAYEESMKYHDYSYKDLLFKRAEIHSTILSIMDDPNYRSMQSEIKPLVDERNKIDDLLKDYILGDNDKITSKNSTEVYNINVPEFKVNNNTIVGWHNKLTDFKNNFPELDAQINKISNEWANNLNNVQLSNLLKYTIDSGSYASSYHEEVEFNNNFNEIIDSAPLISPIKVYSGINHGTRDAIVRQLKQNKNIITIDRAISTSINPAQVNGFMRGKDDDDYGNIALEITTNRGAFMQVISQNADEFEVLVSRGNFKITNIQKNIEFLWGSDGLGRTADTLITLEKI